MQATFCCDVCCNGHDYKTSQNLKKHENSSSHKRKLDPEFAASEEAEKATKKAANKATRDEKETARKAGGKETARKAGDKEKAKQAAPCFSFEVPS